MISYREIMEKLKEKRLKIVIEDRKGKGARDYGIHNHGEFIAYINPADKDPWDVIIPGYRDHLPVGKYFMSNEIMAIMIVPSKNHKFFMRVNYPGFDPDKAQKDIQKYVSNYQKINKMKAFLKFPKMKN